MRITIAILMLLTCAGAAAQDQAATPRASGRAADIAGWCQTMGAGALGMAQDRDRGMSKDAVIAKVVNGRTLSARLRGSIDTMAETAYRYRSFSPGAVKRLTYGICVTGELGILDMPMLKQIEDIVRACAADNADASPAFDQCTDKGFAGLIDGGKPRAAQ